LRLLHTAQRGASQGASLTEALLAFARKQRLTPIPADLNSIIVEMSEILRRSIGPTIEIRHALATDLWPVLIDIGQIETALLNIALNARDAMPGGGMALIETANIGAGCEGIAGRGRRAGLCAGVGTRHRDRDEPRGFGARVSSRFLRPRKSARGLG